MSASSSSSSEMRSRRSDSPRRHVGQRLHLGRLVAGARDGIAVGTRLGIFQRLPHRLFDVVRDRRFPHLGFGVHFGPREFEDFREKTLRQAMPPHDHRRQMTTRVGEPDLVLNRYEALIGHPVNHLGDTGPTDAEPIGDACLDDRYAFLLDLPDRLGVLAVSHGVGRVHEPIVAPAARPLSESSTPAGGATQRPRSAPRRGR